MGGQQDIGEAARLPGTFFRTPRELKEGAKEERHTRRDPEEDEEQNAYPACWDVTKKHALCQVAGEEREGLWRIHYHL